VKRYATFVFDPPWPEKGGGKIKRGADRHYKVIPVQKMPLVIAKSGLFRPAEHSHLYMWVTNNYLKHGIWLMEQLGFDYKTNVGWAKTRAGIGQYFRGKHELILFGVRGDGMHESVYSGRRDIVSWWDDTSEDDTYIEAEHVKDGGKRKHSAKPAVFYDLVEARSKGPYIDMFSRYQHNESWDCWGDEAPEAA
jgi:N6-adenosine-specific RNA methylase IME4